VAKSLDSKYAVFLNDLIEEHSYAAKSDDFQITITDDDLRNLMKIPFQVKDGVKRYSYPQPAALNRRAIKPAVDQIKNADLRFEIIDHSYKKEGGVIYWYFSLVSKKTMLLHNFSVKHAFELDEIRRALKSFGVTPSTITSMVNKISTEKELDYINWNIDIVKSKIQTKTIKKTPASAFIMFFKQNREAHDSKWLEHKKQKDIEDAIRKSQNMALLKERRDALAAEVVKERSESFLKKLHKSGSEREAIMPRFLDYLSKMPLKSSAKLQEVIASAGMTDDILADRTFEKFLNAIIKESVTDEDIDLHMEKTGSSIQI
jgi:hypothetical protein